MANLPYNVATPIVSNLLVHPELRPERLVVTIQKELADRMVAPPATEAYGALSVLCQALAEVDARPGPAARASSGRGRRSTRRSSCSSPTRPSAAPIGDLPWFHSVVRRVFLHRRKNLRSVLSSLFRDRWTKPEVDALLESLGLDRRRPRRGDERRGAHRPGLPRCKAGSATRPGPRTSPTAR